MGGCWNADDLDKPFLPLGVRMTTEQRRLATLRRKLVQGLIEKIYDRDAAGCCWHIVLDDFNYETSAVDFSITVAVKNEHRECVALAMLLKNLTRGQVRHACHHTT